MSAITMGSVLSATTARAIEQISTSTSYDDYAVLFLSLLGACSYLTSGKLWNRPDPYAYIFDQRPQKAFNANASKETRNIAQRLDETNRDIVIFWGSQSGTAEGFAHSLAIEIHSLVRLTKLAIFFASTYGEGDPSDNTTEFWNWLRTKNDASLFNLRYAAFGLGNSNYKYYNKVIDVLVEKLDSFGARSLLAVGKADDANGGTEEDFLEWKEKLFEMFKGDLGFQEHEMEYEASIKIVQDDSLNLIDLHIDEPVAHRTTKKAAGDYSSIMPLTVKEVRELTECPSIGRSCLHLELDLSDHQQIKYKTGDHLGVWAINPEEEVSRLLHVLDLSATKDRPILISAIDTANKTLSVPSPTTVSALFRNYLEICAPVSRETVLALAQFAPSAAIKSMIYNLATDKTSYSAFLASNYVNLGRLLECALLVDPGLSWSCLPLSFVIESLHSMAPRYYSISSSSIISPRQASITVAISPSPLQNSPTITIPGLATSYLSSFAINPTSPPSVMPTLYAHIRRSTFKLPLSPTVPLILVAAGTGIAPLRAFLHERARLASIGREIGSISLFFGCRHPQQDFLYRTELEDLAAGALKGKFQTIGAFSRLQEGKRVYVQDRIREHAEIVARLLADEDAALFVCGATGMAREVDEAIVDAVRRYKGWSEGEVEQWRDGRKGCRRWMEDVWG